MGVNPLQVSENDVEAAVVTFLQVRGWYVGRQHAGRVRTENGHWLHLGEKGRADWIAVRPRACSQHSPDQRCIFRGRGEILFIECKRPGEKPDAFQQAWHEVRRKEGFAVIVCKSIEEFECEYRRYFA